jgi:hypothetical protein
MVGNDPGKKWKKGILEITEGIKDINLQMTFQGSNIRTLVLFIVLLP